MTKKVTSGSRWRGLEPDLYEQRSGSARHRQRWIGPKDLCSDSGTAPALDPTTVGRVVELIESGARAVSPSQLTLAQLRERLRLSQTQVARRLRVSQAAVSDLE